MANGFFDINLGQVLTWIFVLGGFVAMWQKMKDKLEQLGEASQKHALQIEKIQLEGTPPNTVAIAVLRDTTADHSVRLSEQERVSREFSGIRTDVEWIKKLMDSYVRDHKKIT